MEDLKVIIINPFNKTIEEKTIENNNYAFREVIGGSLEFKRVNLDRFIESLCDEKEWIRDEACAIGYGSDIKGINITVHDSGIILQHNRFQIGNDEYLLFHGIAVVSGAEHLSWEDVDLPYSANFLKKIVKWL